jgi:hypothetical protein
VLLGAAWQRCRVVNRLPVVEDEGEFVDDLLRQGEPNRVRQPLAGNPLQQIVGAACRVDPDQDLTARAGA